MMERATEYRSKLAEIRERGGSRWRTPVALREEIVVWVSNLQSTGHGVGAIATAIGLSESALRRWLSPVETSDNFRRVRVGGVAARSKGGALVMVTPTGFRLEGLTVDQAVEVLRRL